MRAFRNTQSQVLNGSIQFGGKHAAGKYLRTAGEPQEFGHGDLITYSTGFSCTWKILKPVEKH
jgi:hypothetical protein